MSEITTYPVLFNQEIYDLNQLKYIDLGLDKTMPNIDEIQEASGIEPNKNTDLVQSGILDGLHRAIRISEEDYNKIIYGTITDDLSMKLMIAEDKEDYYENRVHLQSTTICNYIDGLIKLDKYPKKLFGEYKLLKKFLRYTENKLERAEALEQLRIIANSIIPPQIKFEKVEIVEPSLLANATTREG